MHSHHIFSFVLTDLIKGYKNHKNIYSRNLFHGNDNVCVGFVGWFLYELLLLKIIVSMKRCYVGVSGYIEKYVGFVCALF